MYLRKKTSEGSWRRHDEHLLIAETTSEFLAAIAKLRVNANKRAALTNAGHSLVKSIYDWPKVSLYAIRVSDTDLNVIFLFNTCAWI